MKFYFLIFRSRKMEPMAGIEPATDGLRNRCSTTELHWLDGLKKKRLPDVKISNGLPAAEAAADKHKV
jgi:hypothetical protein